MADRDHLAQSLSEEESELVQLAPAPAAGAGGKKKNISSSPSRKQAQGYKFSGDKLTDNFDFATIKKNGQANNSSNSSSEEGEDQEAFEVLNPEVELNGGASGDQRAKSEVPTTPSKLTTPHKRTAELVETGNDATTGANGSPPSSPAPKKRKAFADFLAEEDAKIALKDKEVLKPVWFWNFLKIILPVRFYNFLKIRLPLRFWNYRKIILSVLVVLVAIAIGLMNSSSWSVFGETQVKVQPSDPPYTWKNAHDAFKKNLQTVKKQFPNQKKETWIQLDASITSTLETPEPKSPASITVLVPPKLSDTFANCFVGKVGETLNNAVIPVLQGLNQSQTMRSPVRPYRITPKTFGGSATITDIRANIESYLKTSGKAILVFDVDKLTLETDLMLFHGLCDNFHALDKRATTLFLVRVPQRIFDKFEWTHARGGDISTEVLNEAFQKVVSADTVPALVARIADGVILLNEGDQC